MTLEKAKSVVQKHITCLKTMNEKCLMFVTRSCKGCPYQTDTNELLEAEEFLYDIVKKQKFGQWVPDSLCNHKPHRIRNTDKWTIYHCSCCGHSNGRRFNDKFCSNCGAQMLILKIEGDSDG